MFLGYFFLLGGELGVGEREEKVVGRCWVVLEDVGLFWRMVCGFFRGVAFRLVASFRVLGSLFLGELVRDY